MRTLVAILLCALAAAALAESPTKPTADRTGATARSAAMSTTTTASSSPAAAEEPASDRDEQLNTNLARTIVLVTDATALAEAMRLEAAIPLSSQRGPDPRASQFFMALVQRRAMLTMLGSPDDPARQHTREELEKVVPALMDALQNLSNGFEAARRAGGWDENAKTLATKGYAAAQAAPFDGSLDELIKDARFQKYLPPYYLEAAGVVPSPAGFSLGVRTYVTEPLFIISVAPGSLAEKLQLRDLDTVQQFNGKQPKDMDDLKHMIKSAAGKTARIRAQRIYDEAREYDVAVPAKLGS